MKEYGSSSMSLQIMESESICTPQRPSRASSDADPLVLSTPGSCWSAPGISAPSLRVERRCSSLEDKAWLTEYAPRMPGTSEDDDDWEEEEARDWQKRFYRYHIPPCFSPSIVTIHRTLPEEETKIQYDDDDMLPEEDAFRQRSLHVDVHRAPRMPFMPEEDDGEEEVVLTPPLRLPDASLRMRQWRES